MQSGRYITQGTTVEVDDERFIELQGKGFLGVVKQAETKRKRKITSAQN